MSIYQSQYLFMKQHFYQQETEVNQMQEEPQESPEKKPSRRSRDKRRKKRR